VDQKLAQKVATTLKALAHPVRLEIVETLQHGEKCVTDIVTALGRKQSITSQQLCMMKDKGVLGSIRKGSKVYYYISNPNVIKLLNCIYSNCQMENPAPAKNLSDKA
jgi:ArsR family transcriptional regulator